MAQNYFPTAQGIIDAALEAIRAIDPEQTMVITTTQRTTALTKLNAIVTSWQAKGMQVWCTKNVSVTLVSAQASYTMGSSGADVTTSGRPLSISQAWLHNTSANTDPIALRIIGREEYNSYTSKATASTPNSVWYDPQYDSPGGNSGASAKGKLFVYPPPDATTSAAYTMVVVYTRPIQDFVAISDGLDFPQEWFNALIWRLAHQLSFSYGLPVMYIDRIKSVADDELETVQGWDRESGSMYLQPDNQGR
jgi:hypothetical protein